MTSEHLHVRLIVNVLVILALARCVQAQGYDTPLTIQGLDRSENPSAASRAAGGIMLGIQNDPALMFLNPSSLQSVTALKISLGGLGEYRSASQIQEYAPLKYYTNFSLLMEGLTGSVPNPDTSNPAANPGDSVQRAYDNMGPDWARKKNTWAPAQAMLAVPVTLGESRFTVGLGFVRYADLNYYYQNNNVLSPSILAVRPYPVLRPPTDANPLITDWSQHTKLREGSISGYGVALAGTVFEKLSLGASAMLLKGSSDDFESYVGRGRLTFYFNYFRLDSLNDRAAMTGTSDYKAQEYTFSATYSGKYLTLGFSVKPPMTITRDYSAQVQADTGGTLTTMSVSGQDKMVLPWRGRVGAAIAVRQDLTLGFEYEFHPYGTAAYKLPDGTESNPWLSASLFHVGAEYVPAAWLTLRGGLRAQAEIFQPEGDPIDGSPVSYTIYSAGAGIMIGAMHVDLTYEYGLMKYDDVWSSEVSRNRESFNTFSADVIYEIPF